MQIRKIWVFFSGSDFEDNLVEKWRDLKGGEQLKR